MTMDRLNAEATLSNDIELLDELADRLSRAALWLEYVRDVMVEPEYREVVRRHMQAAKFTLDPVPGIDLESYIDELIARFSNPEIAYRTAQIAMDGTQKLPKRIFAPTVDALAAGNDSDQFAYVTALWMAYVTRFEKIEDPCGHEVRQSVLAGDGASASLFAIPGLFSA